MSDQILSDDEKDALLDGVESGEVEIQSTDGPKYAAVTEFVISPRNRIVTNSYPRLQNMNRKLAGFLGQATSQLLNEKVEVRPGSLTTSTWGEHREDADEAAIIFEFKAVPLDGSAAVFIEKSAVSHIVETFYGGSKENPPRHEAEGFTPGEINVMSLFCGEALKGIAEIWHSLIVLQPEKAGIHQSTDVVEVIENSEFVIRSEFELLFGDVEFRFHIVWPTSTLAGLLPVLEGQKRNRDAVEDAHWEQVIRGRVPEALVDISSCIGSARMSLRKIAQLKAGDIIEIENPRKGMVFARDVAVLEGRFGVHDGCYAIEATRWLGVDAARAG